MERGLGGTRGSGLEPACLVPPPSIDHSSARDWLQRRLGSVVLLCARQNGM